MKEYIKPEAKLVEFESEKITVDGEMGDGSNTITGSDDIENWG